MLFVYQDGRSLVSLDTSCSQLMNLPQSCLATLPTQPCHLSSASLAFLLVGRAHSPAWHQANQLTHCCMSQGVSWALVILVILIHAHPMHPNPSIQPTASQVPLIPPTSTGTPAHSSSPREDPDRRIPHSHGPVQAYSLLSGYAISAWDWIRPIVASPAVQGSHCWEPCPMREGLG